MAKPLTSEEPKGRANLGMDSVMEAAGRLFDTARPGAVYAEPVSVEGRTVINAAEVLIGTGFGGGGGYSPAMDSEGQIATDASENVGMGSGVGGFAQARPVAVIIIDRDGVRVEPVVDVTKLGLAALTAFGGMAFFLSRMLRRSGRG